MVYITCFSDDDFFDLIKDLKFNLSNQILKKTEISIYKDKNKKINIDKIFSIKLCNNEEIEEIEEKKEKNIYDVIINYKNISNYNLKNFLNEIITKKIKGVFDKKNINKIIKIKKETIYEKNKKYKINIYIPTYYRIEKCIRSIKSIILQAKESFHDVKIYVYDNNTKDKNMKNFLKSVDINPTFGKKNIGKANAVNFLHSNSRKCDFVFSIDSDMYFDDEEKNKKYNIFDMMISVLIEIKDLGLVSSYQKIQSEHWFGKSVFPVKENNFNLGLSKNRAGIAGGCICMKREDWDEIGGYKKNHDIYTGDDGILTKKVYEILAKRCAVTIDYKMTHPSGKEDDEGYNEWKKQSWERDKLSFFENNYKGKNTKGYYD